MPDERIDAALKAIMSACNKARITSGKTTRHARTIGVTFAATQQQWHNFYDYIEDAGYNIQDGVSWSQVGESKNEPIYFYDFSVKVF